MQHFYRKLTTVLLGYLLLCGGLAHAQPTQVWQRTYGASGGLMDDEYFKVSLKLHPNRYVQAGYRYVDRAGGGVSNRQALLFYTAGNGDSLALVALPQQSQALVLALGAGRLPSSAVALGYYLDSLNRPTTFASLVDSLGQPVWTRTFNRDYELSDLEPNAAAAQVVPLPDGYLLVTAKNEISSSLLQPGIPITCLTKLNRAGVVQWQRQYRRYTWINSIVACPDGSYALAGSRGTAPTPGGLLSYDYWLLRLKPNGDTIRSRRFGTQAASDVAYSLALTADDGLLLAGRTIPVRNGPDQGQLLRLDSLDRLLWTQTIVAPQPLLTYGCYLREVRVTAAGQALVAGYKRVVPSAQQGGGGYLALLPGGLSSGSPLWERSYNSTVPFGGGVDALAYEANGTATVLSAAQRTSNDVQLTRFQGLPVPFVPDLCRTPPQANWVYAITAPDSLVCVDLSTAGPRYGELSAWRWDFGDGTSSELPSPRHRYAPGVARPGLAVTLTVTNHLGCATSRTQYPFGVLTTRSPLTQALGLYPNPTAGTATLDLSALPAGPVRGELLNALGQVVQPLLGRGGNGAPTVELDLRGLPAGVYFVRLHTAGGVAVRRLLKQTQ